MSEIKPRFKDKMLNGKNIKIIAGLLVVLLGLLLFTMMRDTTTPITHKQANALYSDNKIEKIIIDGEYIYLKTAKDTYKIYKDAVNKTAFFEKYPVEVVEDNGYIYDIISLLLLIFAFGFFYRLMQQNRLQQLKHLRASSKADGEINS